MYNQITESQIEQLAIELLQSLEWNYVFGPDIAPDGNRPERESFPAKSGK